MKTLRRSLILLTACGLLFAACKRSGKVEALEVDADSTHVAFPLPGDSTVYGLACDGCTDSVVVLLPRDCSDPITYDILDAMRHHRVIGHPKVGDKIAVIPNAEDSLKADMVINIDDLYGDWCYMVRPTLNIPEVDGKKVELPDSVLRSILVPREYGISLRRQWTAQVIGFVRPKATDEERPPVTYPRLKIYNRWMLWNGNLLLTKTRMTVDKDGNAQMTDEGIDTAQIMLLRPDSLVLRQGDTQQGYYRKKEKKEP